MRPVGFLCILTHVRQNFLVHSCALLTVDKTIPSWRELGFSAYMISQGLYKLMEGLTNDVEKSNEMVLIMQDKMEEKDTEIRRLNHELQQRSATMEEEKTEEVSDKKDGDEGMQCAEAEIEI